MIWRLVSTHKEVKLQLQKLISLISLLVEAMDRLEQHILQTQYPQFSPSDIHSGYHRGRRPLVGDIYYPDIISVHHLHRHVIIKPTFFAKYFKYSKCIPLLWKSTDMVSEEVRARAKEASVTEAAEERKEL